MSRHVDLPDYREMEPAVRDRFDRIKERPVVTSVRGLGKTFVSPQGESIRVLEDINFDVHRREFIMVIGPSGCGKSTLIRMIAGLDTPTDGEMLMGDERIKGPGPERGMVFQSYALFPWLTVEKNVMFGMEACGVGPNQTKREAMQWLSMVGLCPYANHYPHQLSGGMKQRVAIARALANKPRVLLMDEPFGALDAQTRCKMQSYLLQIWQKVNVTIIFITHDLDEAVYLADRVVVLGRNPGHIKEIIEVPVPRPRHADQLMSPEFLATKQRLEELIHPPEEREEESPLDIMRMTVVGDEVF